MLVALFLAAELSDLGTFAWANERNVIVLALGPVAILAKVGTAAAFALLAYAFGCLGARDRRLPELGRAMLLVGTAAAAFGAWSNL